MKFNLTYEVVTEKSAEQGDFARHGFVTRNFSIPDRTHVPHNPASFTLRDAIKFFLDREGEGPVEADSCPLSIQCPPRWFNYGGKWDQDVAGYLTIGLHLPDKMTPASKMRVARLLGCYGIRNGGAK